MVKLSLLRSSPLTPVAVLPSTRLDQINRRVSQEMTAPNLNQKNLFASCDVEQL